MAALAALAALVVALVVAAAVAVVALVLAGFLRCSALRSQEVLQLDLRAHRAAVCLSARVVYLAAAAAAAAAARRAVRPGRR